LEESREGILEREPCGCKLRCPLNKAAGFWRTRFPKLENVLVSLFGLLSQVLTKLTLCVASFDKRRHKDMK
jgi:hypothetical protein